MSGQAGAVDSKECFQPFRTEHDEAWLALGRKASVHLCLQCHKCSAGCPVSDRGDLTTSRIVRLTQIGDEETLYASPSIWLCTGCHTCSSRCPAGVDPSLLQDLLKRRSLEKGIRPADPRSFEALDAFLVSMARRGRLSELDMVRRFKLKTRTLFERLILGLAMFFRGKLRLLQGRAAGKGSVRALVEASRIRPDGR